MLCKKYSSSVFTEECSARQGKTIFAINMHQSGPLDSCYVTEHDSFKKNEFRDISPEVENLMQRSILTVKVYTVMHEIKVWKL